MVVVVDSGSDTQRIKFDTGGGHVQNHCFWEGVGMSRGITWGVVGVLVGISVSSSIFFVLICCGDSFRARGPKLASNIDSRAC